MHSKRQYKSIYLIQILEIVTVSATINSMKNLNIDFCLVQSGAVSIGAKGTAIWTV